MKMDKLKSRLQRDRPMKTISLRIPEDVIEDLKRVAPRLGFSGYQPLIRAYIGQGLRVDLERLESESQIASLVRTLRKRGVDEEVLASAVAEAKVEYEI
jgi:hypothetical protein